MKTWKLNLVVLVFTISIITSCSNQTESNNSSEETSQSNVSSDENSATTSSEAKESTVIGNLEIAAEDFPEELGWFLAGQECSKLGDGWRLPTIEEMHIIYDNKEMIGGFPEYGTYWTSTTYENESNQVWTLSVSDGKQYQMVKASYNYKFRPVRDKN